MSFKRRPPTVGVDQVAADDVVMSQQPTESSPEHYPAKSLLLAFLGALLLQAVTSGDSLISKAALSRGMRPAIYVLYRNILASIVLWSLILCKRALPPTPSPRMWLWIALLALLEPALDQNLFYAGAEQIPASFSVVMDGITPAVTFFCALLFGFEKMDCKKNHNLLRLLGAVLMIVGAGTMCYPGKHLSLSKSSKPPRSEFLEAIQSWSDGPLYNVGAVLCNIFYTLFMGKVLKFYPFPLGLVVYSTSIGTILDTIIAIGIWHNYKDFWKITPDISLIACLYGGIFTGAFGFWLTGKLIQMRGPIFVSSFSPLGILVVMLIGVLILGETIYMGSVLGMVIVLIGVACIQWGEYLGTKTGVTGQPDK